jgi:hypothetical protein
LLDTLTWLADGVILLLFILISAVIVTGGWQFQLSSQAVSMRSIDNLLLAVALLIGGRLLRPQPPLLWTGGITVASLAEAALAALQRAQSWLAALGRRDVTRLLLILATTVTAIRLYNIIVHFGFITGDDVEIHEMTLARVLGRDWPVWDLRSAFYPMTFIYPVQQAVALLGIKDVYLLVAAARVAVSMIAAVNIALVYRAGRSLHWSRGQSLVAASLFAVNHLHIAYGSAELPRVVATSFMLVSFCALRGSRLLHAAVAGISLAVGACMRFGEIVFIVPALLTLVLWPPTGSRKRPTWSGNRGGLARRVFLFVVAGAATGALALGVSDMLYWGSAFHSSRAIVDYTLVNKLSSRGYEPFFYYVTHVSGWSDVLLVILALLGGRVGGALPLVWALLPIGLLSVLPHKEARYVIVTIPFFALTASRTLWVWIEKLRTQRSSQLAVRAPMASLCLVLCIVGATLFDVSRFRFRRSEDQVRLAWMIAGSGQRGIAAEQLWRFGGHLYLADNEPVIDLDPGLADADPTLTEVLCRPDVHWAAMRRDRLSDARRAVLRTCGFTSLVADRAGLYVVYQK